MVRFSQLDLDTEEGRAKFVAKAKKQLQGEYEWGGHYRYVGEGIGDALASQYSEEVLAEVMTLSTRTDFLRGLYARGPRESVVKYLSQDDARELFMYFAGDEHSDLMTAAGISFS